MKKQFIRNSVKLNKKIFGALSLILFFGFVLLVPSTSSAQVDNPYSVEKLSDIGTNKDFVVGPGKAELEVNPGESRVYPIKVTNRMGETKTFKIEVEDFTGSNDPEQTVVLLGDERGPYSLKDYLSVSAYEFTLESGERATIPVTISIPTDEEPGGRYGSVIVSTVSTKADLEEGSAGSAIISRIGVLFFVKIPGGVEQAGVLKDFRTKAGQKIFGKNKIDFEISFENTGSVHLNPYGELRIKNWLGKEVGNEIIDPWFAMPDSLRFREISWGRSFLLGMYKAEASINRGYGESGGTIDHDSFTFFVIPWKLIVGLLGSIIALILIVRFFLSKFEFKRKV